MDKYQAINRILTALRRETEAISVLQQASVEAGTPRTIDLRSRFIDRLREVCDTYDVFTSDEWEAAVNRGDIIE